jgi:NAD+ synthase
MRPHLIVEHCVNHLSIDPAHVAELIEAFIGEQVTALRRDGVVLGLSGGIDSAAVALLAVRALGPDRVLALLLPERDSSPDSEQDALLLIEQLGIRYKKVELTPMLSSLGVYESVPLQFLAVRKMKEAVVRQQHELLVKALGERPFLAGLLGTQGLAQQRTLDAGQAYARAKHRMRLVTLYFHAELENLMVLGTTNRSEAMTGFVVKWGDNVADVEPILPLYKTQVRQLARFLDVPQPVMSKAPSPDLMPGITDEFALGLSYEKLDAILWEMEQRQAPTTVAGSLDINLADVEYVHKLHRRSAHMRELPPMPVLP